MNTEQEEASTAILSSPSASRALRVLIVEDSPADAELMLAQLVRHGFHLDAKRVDTERAFADELREPPDLILADYSVPGFGAVRALEVIQECSLNIPFIVVSGTIGDEAAVSIVKCGATDYVLKSQLSQLGRKASVAIRGQRSIAYFSMEIALQSQIPTYSGGLGVLAGDTIRSAADLRVPMVALTLLHRKGYFRQHLSESGWQTEEPVSWSPSDYLEELPNRFSIMMEDHPLQLRLWKYEVKGIGGYSVPVYFLDADLPENSDWERTLTHFLYGGDWYYRLNQEIVLGIGGVQALRLLGYDKIERFHMNEGHASLLTLALLREHAEKMGKEIVDIHDLAAVRQKCIFTTHTPVPAGHDHFPLATLSHRIWGQDSPLGKYAPDVAERVFGKRGDQSCGPLEDPSTTMNMTYLGLNMSGYINGVAKRHGEVSRMMFGGYQIDAITNGVHVATWSAPAMQELFDRFIPDWRQDNFSLRYAARIPKAEIWAAHLKAKAQLIDLVNRREPGRMSTEIFTIGFARRATAYKRLDLLFSDVTRLRKICQEYGSIQVIFSGKAHPSDQDGKLLIQKVFQMREELGDDVVISFLEDYDMEIARLVVSGVDLWLNTPQPPLEASGTSGMKAALNGVPSLSILDGWWTEGHIEGITGWSIVGEDKSSSADEAVQSAACMYRKLEREIIPVFYDNPDRYISVMQHAIALNGSFFNTQRMLQQYVLRAYFTLERS